MRPPYARTMFELLDEQACRYPGGVAVICRDRSITYPELAQRARRAAGLLRAQGVRRGDRVGLLLNNRAEWLEVAFGAALLGAVLAPLSTWSTKAELEYLLADSEVTLVIALAHFGREDFAAMLRDLLPQGGRSERFPRLRGVLLLEGQEGDGFPDYAAAVAAQAPLETPPPGEGASARDDFVILYTSGSTSRPKAIPLMHYAVVENGFNIGERQGLGPQDRVLLSPPLFWTYGGVNALPATFTHGAALVLQPRFEAGEALELIERHGCTSLYTLPGMTDAMVRHPDFRLERTRTLRRGMTIGSPQDVVKAATQLGAREICNIYGSSETGGNCCVTQHDWPLEHRANSQGHPLPGVEMRIVSVESGQPVAAGEPGVAEVRGPYVMRGYVGGSAQHNAAVFTADGWFRTGDIGTLTPGGEFNFLGRDNEMIKRAGINVSPAEVEDVLMQHGGVAQAGVVGVPSAERGEMIVAFVVPKAGAALDAKVLVDHCRAVASSYKVPDRFEILDALPTTVTGKLMRRELKSAAAKLVGAGA
ncbi:class I adenylate-forming enzyme family protein [Roseomonas haemaphysalidis]|uniref:Acyl--CoA ligase n=1 Tax=Roseomonas haemaphysalidis TaxID=2768162 RepID=A0ABS3KV64_9PROT|nr:class I adenylate-forming enzyme family protein [Roseomonas haemaphysalidis]MBO1081319.1 acyl--CoA ligase [Roseomonas haemaphysalidis]